MSLHFHSETSPGWWLFSNIFWNFHPELWGKMNWRAYFSNGLVQPPTSHCIQLFFVSFLSFNKKTLFRGSISTGENVTRVGGRGEATPKCGGKDVRKRSLKTNLGGGGCHPISSPPTYLCVWKIFVFPSRKNRRILEGKDPSFSIGF